MFVISGFFSIHFTTTGRRATDNGQRGFRYKGVRYIGVPLSTGKEVWEYREQSKEDSEAMDSSFKQLFIKLAGVDREIDAFELQQILSTATKKVMSGKEFSLEACRSIIDLKDDDKTGKLDYDEFKEVWAMVKELLKIFAEFDKDNSGTMDMFELRDALRKQGIHLSQSTLDAISARFNNKKGTVCFDDFLQITCRIYSLKDDFDRRAGRDGKASFTLDEFLRGCLTL